MIETSRNRSPSLRFVGMLLFCLLCAIVLAPSAVADTLYTYTGNPFTTFFPPDMCIAGVGECQISLSFEVPSPFPANLGAGTFVTPLAFSITDGVHTLTQSNAITQLNTPDFFFSVGTDANGQIDVWQIDAGSDVGPLGTQNFFFDTTRSDLFPAITGDSTSTFIKVDASRGFEQGVGGAANLDNPGTWTMSSVPEPSSLLLLGSGLLGMLGLRRKPLV